MGAPKTKTIGGGGASPLANEWFSFLGNTLKGPQNTGGGNPALGGPGGGGGMPAPNNQPGAGAIEGMMGNMLPNNNAGATGGMTGTMGPGTNGFNANTMYTGAGNQGSVTAGPSNYINPGMGRPNATASVGGPTPSWYSPNNSDVENATAAGDTNWLAGKAAWEAQQGGNSGSVTNNNPAYALDPRMMASGGNPAVGGPANSNPGNGFFNGIKTGLDNANANKAAIGGVGGFQGGLESLMNPDIAKMIQGNPMLAQLMNFNPSTNLPNAPTWENTLYKNPNEISAPNVNYNNAAAGNTDVNSFMGQFGGDPSKMLQSLGINPSALTGMGLSIPGLSTPSGDFQYGGGSLRDFTQDPSYNAIKQDFARQDMKNIANLRERFGMMGNTMSSGASLGEAQYLAESQPKQIMALQDLGRSIQGLDLQQQGVNNSLRTNLLGNQVQDNLGRLGISADLAKAGGQLGSSNAANLMQFLSSTQGQNLGAATSLANTNAGNTTNTNISNSQGGLDASKANSINSINAQGMNANNTMDMNKIRSGDNIAKNTFNQNNFSQNSSNALNDKQMVNQFQQFLGSAGLDLQQLAQSGQMNVIAQLFSAFQQAAGIGTPQAQTVQQPSQLSQLANFGLGAAGTIGGIMSGNPAAALGGASKMGGAINPQISSLGSGGYFSGPAPSLFPGR